MNSTDTLTIAENLVVSRKELDRLTRQFHIRKLSLFGSAARGELRADSDIDLLVEFEPGKAPSLWSAAELQSAFSRLFGGRHVDIAPPEILRNPYRRKTIERDLKVLIDEAA
jgi:predicted nucleotidyltransferase